jgi:hypothetical protein
MTIHDRVLNRIRGKGRGAVFTPKDFLDLGSRAAVDQTLSRLARDGTVTRLRRGVYFFPKVHPRLGALSPDPDTVARAVVGPHVPLQMSGATALNAVGLTTQVPTRTVYYSDRAHRDVPIGRSVVSIKRASARALGGSNRPSGQVLQALRYLGRTRVDTGVTRALQRTLPDPVKRDLRDYVRQHPRSVADWMRGPIEQITQGV